MLLIITRTLLVNLTNLDLLLTIVCRAIPKLYITRILNLLVVSSIIILTSTLILSIALMLASLALLISIIITLEVGK